MFTATSSAQVVTVKGIVVESGTKKPVSKATVSVRNSKNTILYGTVTSAKGEFDLSVNSSKIAGCLLYASKIGYKEQSCRLTGKTQYSLELETKAFVLKDVYVEPEKIRHRNDTTTYHVASFTTPKDRTIGDVLKNMPGIDVEKSGRISYNGKAIDEFYIEGIDLFDGQYNIATRNISHDIISHVDIIENHHSAKAMRKSKADGSTVLNLNLKENAKGRWSGNIKAGAGIPKIWEEELFAAVLSDGNQTALTAKTNNSGKDIISENYTLTFDEFLRSHNLDNPLPVMNISQDMPGGLDDSRTNNSRTHIVNVANIQKISETAVLRSKMYYSDDRNVAHHETGEKFFLEDSTFTRTTSGRSIVNSRELAASLLYKNDRTDGFFSDEIKYLSSWDRSRSRNTGDYTNTTDMRSDAHSVENRLQWIKPAGKWHFDLYSMNKYSALPEDLTVNADTERHQKITRKNFLSSTKLNLAYNMKRFAIAADAEQMISTSGVTSDYRASDNDTTICGNLNINYLAYILRGSLTYKYRGIRIETQIPCSFYHYFGAENENRLFFAPKLTFTWEINAHWKIGANVSAGSHEANINGFYDTPVMTDYRTFRSRSLIFDGQRNSNAFLVLNYADYANMFFANANVGYTKNNDNACLIKRINNGFIEYSTVPGRNVSEGLTLLGNASKRITLINGTLNAKCLYTTRKSRINQNGILTNYDTDMLQTSLSVNSNVQRWIDIVYNINFTTNTLSMTSTKTTYNVLNQKLQLTLSPTDALNVSFVAEHDLNHYEERNEKNAFFGDISCSYLYRKTEFTLRINNIFNQRYYSSTAYNDLSSSYNKYSLRGRDIIFGAVMYF